MARYRKLIFGVLAVIFAIIGAVYVISRMLYVMDNTEYGIVSSCYAMVAVFAPLFAFGFCSGGFGVIASKLNVQSVGGAIICFVIGIASFFVFFNITDICHMIGLR